MHASRDKQAATARTKAEKERERKERQRQRKRADVRAALEEALALADIVGARQMSTVVCGMYLGFRQSRFYEQTELMMSSLRGHDSITYLGHIHMLLRQLLVPSWSYDAFRRATRAALAAYPPPTTAPKNKPVTITACYRRDLVEALPRMDCRSPKLRCVLGGGYATLATQSAKQQLAPSELVTQTDVQGYLRVVCVAH
eukprot:1195159-Prorocentrum_minimum.AAC.6